MLAENVNDDRRSALETPSGKGQDDENFPVASIILSKRVRADVARFYDFARAADDIADNPALSGDEKIARLNAFEDALTAGAGRPDLEIVERFRSSLEKTGVTDRHGRDLLAAFRQDARKARYESWDALLGYCELSANPVGRFLLDLHGENRDGYRQSDALCTVLQVLNHLQDCGDDKRELDRIYIPADWVGECGSSLSVLESGACDAGFRRVIDRMLDACDELLDVAAALPSALADTRLAINSAMIVCLARRLSHLLRKRDPLAERVSLTKTDFVLSAVTGLVWGLLRRRPARPATGDAP